MGRMGGPLTAVMTGNAGLLVALVLAVPVLSVTTFEKYPRGLV